jgi:5'-nucleotidase
MIARFFVLFCFAGNLVTDIMVAALNADCALLNSGTLRSDARHPAGKFLLRVILF